MYNIIRIFNKNNNNSYIVVGKNTEYKVKETINNLANKDHKSPILQKEFNEYKKQLKKEYKNNSLYKYINFDLLVFDTYYNYELLEVMQELNFDIADKYINEYRIIKKGYNQYLYEELKIYFKN